MVPNVESVVWRYVFADQNLQWSFRVVRLRLNGYWDSIRVWTFSAHRCRIVCRSAMISRPNYFMHFPDSVDLSYGAGRGAGLKVQPPYIRAFYRL